MARELKYVISGDERDFTRALKSVDAHLGRAEKRANRFGKVMNAAIGVGAVGALGALGKKAIDTASDIDEQYSKLTVLFGKTAASAIDKFAKSAATSFGLSRQEALTAAGQFGAFFTAAGKGGEEASAMSVKFTKLAADMAAFNNVPVADALDALRSGLAGETEPLRRFNVMMNDAALRTEAVKQGLIATTKDALTPQQKTLAAYGLVLEQTNVQQGNFGDTSKGLAGQQKILQAELKNVTAELGTALLPVAKDVASAMVDFIGGMKDGTGAGGDFADALRTIGDVAKPIAQFLKDHPGLIAIAAGAWASYKVAAMLALAPLKIAAFKRMFVAAPAAGAAAGTAAGAAMAASTATAAAAAAPAMAARGAVAGAFAAAGAALGAIAGVAAAAALAYVFRKELKALADWVNRSDITARPDAFIQGQVGVHQAEQILKPIRALAPQPAPPTGGRSPAPSARPVRPRMPDRRRRVLRTGDKGDLRQLVSDTWRQVKRLTKTTATEPKLRIAGKSDYYDPSTHTITLSSDWPWLINDPEYRQEALDVIFHELVHAAQRGSISSRMAEGGAVVFTQRFARGAFKRLGLDYHPQSVDLLTPFYKSAARSVRRRGDHFIRKGQFATGETSRTRRRRLPSSDSGARTRPGSAPSRGGARGVTRPSGTGSSALGKFLEKSFGLRQSSGYRTPEQNAAANGAPNSWHMRGSASNPGAIDLVGPTNSPSDPSLNAALAWVRENVPGLAEAEIHNYGSGWHLHIGGPGVMNWRVSGAPLAPTGGGGGAGSLGAGSLGGFGSLGGLGGVSLPPVRKVKQGTVRGDGRAGVGRGTGTRFQDLRPMGNVSTPEGIAEQAAWISRRLAMPGVSASERAALTAELDQLAAKYRELTAPEPVDTAMQALDADLIAAQLSGDKAWERSVLEYRAAIARQRYDQALATPDRADDVTAGQFLQQALGDLEAIKDSVDNGNALLQQQLDLEKQRADRAERQAAVIGANSETILRAFTEVVNGKLGVNLGLGGKMLASAPGRVGSL